MVTRSETALAVSDETFEMAKSWLSRCQKDHWRCKHTMAGTEIDEKTAPATLPTRVILVSHDEPAKLVVTDGKPGSFAALSYRWGRSRTLVTTQDNLKDMQVELPVNQ